MKLARMPVQRKVLTVDDVFYGYHISKGFRRVTIWAFEKETHKRICVDTCSPLPVYDRSHRIEVIIAKLSDYGITFKTDGVI